METNNETRFPNATIIADSITNDGDRVTTMELDYHRYIAEEVLVHRNLSRNSASSRAIPVRKRIQSVMDDPAEPNEWHYNKPGMQGTEELSVEDLMFAKQVWLKARDAAVDSAKRMLEIGPVNPKTGDPLGVHKQIANRLLHPFLKHKMIVTGTEWQNLFAQREHKDAQPEFRLLAGPMREALEDSTPTLVKETDWHLPYIIREDRDWALHQENVQSLRLIRALSVARCARVSYLTHDGIHDPLKDIELFNKLIEADPPHLSPFEHICRPMFQDEIQVGNLEGWRQLRHSDPKIIVLE